jgi:RNA polymerase sigma factor (sigma-70 family)
MAASHAQSGTHLLEAVVRENRDDLLAFVRRRAGHIVDPEDVVQQAAVHALSSIEQLRDPMRARPWLFRIVRNVLADELRAVGVPMTRPVDDDVDTRWIESGETCRCAVDLARTLKPEYRDILERVVIDDVPVTSLATDLGLTANNAMVRLHRARKALRSVLQEHCGSTSLRACLGCVCEERGCCAL